jgi:hypothetical protein
MHLQPSAERLLRALGWWISTSLCSAESLHGTSPVRPTQEGLITKSLHGTREKLLMCRRRK